MTPARTRLLLIVLLLVLVNLGPLSALADRGPERDLLLSILLTNLIVLGAVWLFLALRNRTRPELRMVATHPPTLTTQEPALERIHGNDYVVRGEVREQEGDQVWLAVADRTVRVTLDGHPNPGSTGDQVEVRGTMVG